MACRGICDTGVADGIRFVVHPTATGRALAHLTTGPRLLQGRMGHGSAAARVPSWLSGQASAAHAECYTQSRSV